MNKKHCPPTVEHNKEPSCGDNRNEISGRGEEERWAGRRGESEGKGVRKGETERRLYTPVRLYWDSWDLVFPTQRASRLASSGIDIRRFHSSLHTDGRQNTLFFFSSSHTAFVFLCATLADLAFNLWVMGVCAQSPSAPFSPVSRLGDSLTS